MDSVSKILRTLCCLLILALQLKGSESNDQLVPDKIIVDQKVTIEITNKLDSKGGGVPPLSVHCRDKFHDLHPVTLKFGETFRFRILPNIFASVTLYYCRFVWSGGNHRFDIYVQERDYECHHGLCYWEIFNSGPCGTIQHESHSSVCFLWNKDSTQKNNTISS